MKNIKIYSLLLIITLTSCVKEDYFGLSDFRNIKTLLVSNQSGNSVINNDSLIITVNIPAGIDLSTVSIQNLVLSSFASSDKQIGDTLNLNEKQYILVTAENGNSSNWSIVANIASSEPQLDNWELNEWYLTTSDYYEPGEDAATTIWGTGNPGTQIINKLATIPLDFGDGNKAAYMETLNNGAILAAMGMPISAGSIFTGYFNTDNLNPSDPSAAIEFGTPFTGRPDKLRFKFQYEAGDVNKDKNGDVLSYPDMLDIYALLEVRLGGTVQRLATAWFRSTETVEDLTTNEIDFYYGELDDSFPDYMKPTDGSYVSNDSAVFVLPTHITFVATSSFEGDYFSGAIGSKLVVDDVEMVYNSDDD